VSFHLCSNERVYSLRAGKGHTQIFVSDFLFEAHEQFPPTQSVVVYFGKTPAMRYIYILEGTTDGVNTFLMLYISTTRTPYLPDAMSQTLYAATVGGISPAGGRIQHRHPSNPFNLSTRRNRRCIDATDLKKVGLYPSEPSEVFSVQIQNDSTNNQSFKCQVSQ